MGFPFLFFNLGSLMLGVTVAVVILSSLGSRHGKTDISESCLISVICLFGSGVSVLLFATALMV